jgi:uncharacterized protein
VKRCLAGLILLFGFRAWAAEVIPPAPSEYFNDYAHVVSPQTASQLNTELENFERQSSDQILVAIYPKMQSDSSIEDYTVRVARAWHVGQKGKNNGAVLFVFIQDRAMFLEVGYGLEGVLPDALCKRIIDEQISPRFHSGDFDGGLTAGVRAILGAVKGEYQGTGTTVAERQYGHSDPDIVFVLVLVAFVLMFITFLRGGSFGRGYSCWTMSSSGWSQGPRWSGGGWGGGGFSGGGFSGGFAGGGGSFGGGGAGGSW